MSANDSTPVNPRMAARPTTYKGVKMRSRLEAAWAEQFDAVHWTWQYEPHCFATSEGQYLPDFHLSIPLLSDNIYVEVKPAYFMTQEGNGWSGNHNDISTPTGWNTACDRITAKVQRLHDIIAANVAIDLFLVCTSADDGEAGIHSYDPNTPQNDRTPVVTPAHCSWGGHVSLAQYPRQTGCPEHYRSPWREVPAPVSSLYAPKGFLTYDETTRVDNLHARLRRDK